MIRNRYIGRTFIQPSQALRQRGVTVKLTRFARPSAASASSSVDDSIVRGTTTKQIVSLLRRAGAAEIHLRISSPPIHHPCFYGIDTQIERELIASTHSVDEIRDFVGADSLGYLSIKGVLMALELPTSASASPASTATTRAGPLRRASPQVRARGERPGRSAAVTTDGERRRAYAAAGVDVGAGARTVELIRAAVESTRRPEQLGALGGFGAAIRVPDGYRDPVLVGATDGVGTKTQIARAMRRYDTIGLDLVAMCADDVLCSGAAPFFFLDYIAVGELVPEDVRALVEGIGGRLPDRRVRARRGRDGRAPRADGGRRVRPGRLLRWVVERDRLIDGSAVREGDAIVGLYSSGIHANGYSLVRAAITDFDLDLERPYQEQLRRSLGEPGGIEAMADEPGYRLATLGEVLLRRRSSTRPPSWPCATC